MFVSTMFDAIATARGIAVSTSKLEDYGVRCTFSSANVLLVLHKIGSRLDERWTAILFHIQMTIEKNKSKVAQESDEGMTRMAQLLLDLERLQSFGSVARSVELSRTHL